MSKSQPAHIRVKQTHRQPSVYEDKKTVSQVTKSAPASVQLANDFFTKQRPLSWQYYYRSFTLNGFGTAGGSDALNTGPNTVSAELDTIPEGRALVVNHFRVSFGYKPFLTNTTTIGQDVYTFFEDLQLIDLPFSFGLASTQTSLADVSALYTGFYQPGRPIDPVENPNANAFSGYRILNQNVLQNGDSSTSLYILEPSILAFQYVLDLTSTDLRVKMQNLVDTSGKFSSPTLFIEVRGHLLNRADGQLLRDIARPTNTLI